MKKEKGMNIFEVMEYGPICAGDQEFSILITVNGAYLNLWVGDVVDGFHNTDCRSLEVPDDGNGLYAITAANMKDQAEEYLKDIIGEDHRDE